MFKIISNRFLCTRKYCTIEKIRKALFAPLQTEEPKKVRKISVVGAAGHVGVQICYDLFMANLCGEIVMVDIKKNAERLKATWQELNYCTAVQKGPVLRKSLEFQTTKNSDLIILAAGIPVQPGQSRLDIFNTNLKLLQEIIPPLAKLSPDSVFLVTANPTDLLSYFTWKISGFPKNRILGTGTELDSSRFRYFIARKLGVHASNVFGWVVGEHGDSSVPVWSGVNVGGVYLRDINPKIGKIDDKDGWDSLHKEVIEAGPMLVKMKGWTDWAISFVNEDITRAILYNELTVHAVSVQLQGLYGITTDCFLSFPCVVGNRGIKQIVKLCLSDDEIQKLQKSAKVFESITKQIKL